MPGPSKSSAPADDGILLYPSKVTLSLCLESNLSHKQLLNTAHYILHIL